MLSPAVDIVACQWRRAFTQWVKVSCGLTSCWWTHEGWPDIRYTHKYKYSNTNTQTHTGLILTQPPWGLASCFMNESHMSHSRHFGWLAAWVNTLVPHQGAGTFIPVFLTHPTERNTTNISYPFHWGLRFSVLVDVSLWLEPNAVHWCSLLLADWEE